MSERKQGAESKNKKVAVLGQVFVGLPLAMRAVDVGYEVVGFGSNVEHI